jgi:hypothetical protein
MRELYKMKKEYMNQRWYNGDDVFELDFIYKDRHIHQFGTDCSWTNFRTKETINIWDRCMCRITSEEAKQLIREYNLQKLEI